MTAYAGIDYSLGRSNVNKETGIHYGVISQHSIMPEALDDMEMDYGRPTCPECGNEIDQTNLPDNFKEWDNCTDYGCDDFACIHCEHLLDSSEVFSEEALGFTYDKDGYKLCDCLDSDIFIIKAPYYTFAQFCSPCVPGAGNLDTYCPDGPKTYCLGHDWFDSGKAPYPVYSVETGKEV
jgi:hypothetical protein